MYSSYDIIVIILSVTLFFSLVIWISVGVLFVKVLQRLKDASDTAKVAAEHVEEFTSQLKNVGKMSAAGSAAAQIMKIFKAKGKK